MKNLLINKTSMQPIAVFNLIIKKKRDGKHKRLSDVLNIKNDIIKAYNQYENAFNQNQLAKISSNTVFEKNKDALISIYSYNNEELQKYKTELMTSGNFEDDECPICQIDTISCFDHFLPKTKFPEFAINIHNLIPSCSICNNKKKETFLDENNKQKYINVYLDIIPSNKHFLHLKYNGQNTPIFFIGNFDNMDSLLYERIENTFRDFLILDRYNKRMYKEIQSLRTMFKNYLFFPKTRLTDLIKKRIKESELQNGETHWKTLLYKELVNNNNLLDFIITKPKQ